MEYKGIKLTLDMDTKEFDSNINRVKNEANSLNNDINKLKKSLKLDPSNLEAYTQLQSKLKTKIEETRKAADVLQTVLNQGLESGQISKTSSTFANLTLKIAELKDQTKKSQKELDLLNANTLEKSLINVDDKANIFFGNLKANLASSAIQLGIKAIADGISAVVNAMKSLAVGYYNLIKQGVEYNAQIQGYQTTINALTNSEEVTKQLVADMKELGIIYGYDATSLLEMSQKLIAAGVNAEDCEQQISSIVSVLSLMGKGNAELKRTGDNLLQIKQNGTATAKDLREFANNGISIYTMLAEYSDKYKGDYEATSVTYTDIINAIIKATTDADSIFLKSGEIRQQTFQGQMDRLQASWQMLCGAMAEDTTSKLTQSVLPAVNEFMGELLLAFNSEEGGMPAVIEAFKNNIGTLISTLSDSGIVEGFLNGATALLDAIKIAFDPETEQGAKNLAALQSATKSLMDLLISFLTSESMMNAFTTVGVSIGGAIAKGIGQAIEKYLMSLEFDVDMSKVGGSMQYASGYRNGVNSLGFGLNSGGFMSGGITLNNNFNITNGNNINEQVVSNWADIMVEQINSRLGEMI